MVWYVKHCIATKLLDIFLKFLNKWDQKFPINLSQNKNKIENKTPPPWGWNSSAPTSIIALSLAAPTSYNLTLFLQAPTSHINAFQPVYICRRHIFTVWRKHSQMDYILGYTNIITSHDTITRAPIPILCAFYTIFYFLKIRFKTKCLNLSLSHNIYIQITFVVSICCGQNLITAQK